MDTTTVALMGVGGLAVGCGVSYVVASRFFPPKSNNSGSPPLPTATATATTQPPKQPSQVLGNKWSQKIRLTHLPHDTVLYNAVDGLSVYGHRDEDIFLDLVYYIDKFCNLQQRAMRMTPNNKDYALLYHSNQLVTILFNIIAALEKRVYAAPELAENQPYEVLKRYLRDYNVRAQFVMEIVSSYHKNIIKQLNQ